MPVFQESSTAARDSRILPSRALPLPRLSPKPAQSSESQEQREVVVIGAGPSGLFLTLLLARYGITESSLLCLDSKPSTLKAGQADGLQPRTLEVLQSLGIASEILDEGCHMEEVSFWNPSSDSKGIERTAFAPDVNVPARFPFEVTIHQGRIERILQENLSLYAPTEVLRRSHRFVDYEIDTDEHAEYPVLVNYECDLEDGTTEQGSLRTKYLVGADGAHSKVRKCMGLELQGETSDHIWGVCDFIADTDFPDIRKRSAVHSPVGSVMIIPRERIATGEYLTRLYVQVPGEVHPETDHTVAVKPEDKTASKKRRGAVTLDYILEQASAVFSPYKIAVREGTVPDWWAAYQIGQRMTSKFSSKTPDGVERIFIVGDACHTHSPKAGQGMNVSMMDSYNLAWKLAHSINGLTPLQPKGTADPVLETFDFERTDIARQLIDFDTKFSHMFSGKIATGDDSTLTHDQFLQVFSEGSGFTSGCGYEYQSSRIVQPSSDESNSAFKAEGNAQDGCLTPGRRILNVELKRYADGSTRQLHDEMPSTGRYRLMVMASDDLLDSNGASQATLRNCETLLHKFPADTIDLIVLHPLEKRFEWSDLPISLKKTAEMRIYGLSKKEDAFEILGVPKRRGSLVVIRPDGYVGMLARLDACGSVESYFESCLVKIA
ncbi:related to phenol hydroxylase [Ramularia collo-cygni]|uniref:Related to phenol hydroxylase n=1 Tax=Ramularia collo-cygni TaxID=112498 RepID=A0A2D3ULM0_9PEZI|nr:related to phenol hydroxylase [Ramularia collo-cygni]CZT15142.1 related to phenol hydroxylase [Ramularia collo-cygni]